MDAAAEIGRNPVGKHQIQPEFENTQAYAGWNAEPVSRDQSLRRERGRGRRFIFPVQLATSRIVPTLLYVMIM